MSYASRNNGKITNRPSGGGSSKAGLHPTATHFYIASSTGNNYYIRGRNSLVNNNNCTNDPSTIKKIFVDFINSFPTTGAGPPLTINNNINVILNYNFIPGIPDKFENSDLNFNIGIVNNSQNNYSFYFPIIHNYNSTYNYSLDFISIYPSYEPLIKHTKHIIIMYDVNSDSPLASLYKIKKQYFTTNNYVVDIEYLKYCNGDIKNLPDNFIIRNDYLKEGILSDLHNFNITYNNDSNTTIAFF